MNLISENPFRILGLLLGASASQKNRQLNRLKKYIEAEQKTDLDRTYAFITALLMKLPYVASNLPLEFVNDIELDNFKIPHKFTTDLERITGDGEDEGVTPGGSGKIDIDELYFYNKMTDNKSNMLFKTLMFNEMYDRQVRGLR